jgi:hypothetical protein
MTLQIELTSSNGIWDEHCRPSDEVFQTEESCCLVIFLYQILFGAVSWPHWVVGLTDLSEAPCWLTNSFDVCPNKKTVTFTALWRQRYLPARKKKACQP